MNSSEKQHPQRGSGTGEGYEGETPQVSNRICKTLLLAQGAWFKVVTAEASLRFLSTAQELGINTNDITSFLKNQKKLRKVRTDAKHNSKLYKEHLEIGNNLMTFKVEDQALVLEAAQEAKDDAREQLREAAHSSKCFRRLISKLNYMARDLNEELE